MAETEIWKDIPWYDWRYQASNKWNIKRIDYGVLIQSSDKDGYKKVGLRHKWKKTSFFVHRLVAITFINEVEHKKIVNHKNCIKTDNRVENLEWCTSAENTRHWWKNGMIKTKEYNKIGQYNMEWVLIKVWDFCMDIQRELWINNSRINSVCRWKKYRKTAWWFMWKFITN